MVASRHNVTNDSYGPGILMACIFPLHAFWFYGCLKGFVKRAKSAQPKPIKQGTVTASPSPSGQWYCLYFKSCYSTPVLRLFRVYFNTCKGLDTASPSWLA